MPDLPLLCRLCNVATCAAGHCLTHTWRSRSHYPERTGQRCCVLRVADSRAAIGLVQVRFEDGEISRLVPKGCARMAWDGERNI